MKPVRPKTENAPGAVQLLEESTALLRSTPIEHFALYYIGTLPFAIALLWFWADMSRSSDAAGRLAASSLGLTVLFVWMKFWQARFAARLSATLKNSEKLPKLSATLLHQSIIQPGGLVLLIISSVISIPFAWFFAFFQNVTSLDGENLGSLFSRAYRQARLWPKQNHLLLLILMLIGLIIFANYAVAFYIAPRLLNTLFGIESIFANSSRFLLNSTFWAAVTLLTHLTVDPLVKAAYVLRCHYGEALATGEDLIAELQRLKNTVAMLAIAFLVLISMAVSGVQAAEPEQQIAIPQTKTQSVDPIKLEKSIDSVIADPRFSWRLPRESVSGNNEVPGFVRSSAELLRDWLESLGKLWERFMKWLQKMLPKPKAGSSSGQGAAFSEYVSVILYLLLAVLIATGAVYFWRRFKKYKHQPEAGGLTPVVFEPDLEDEELSADELSEDRWSNLANEMFAKGELRLGLRAIYLACLSALGDARLIQIARFKSNHEYERELLRHSHALPQLIELFSWNLSLFEAVWYGMHPVEKQKLEQFISNHQRILANVRQI